jgi:large subunit ribosomal protein L15
MPLHRRLPKRGFTNIFARQFVVVNVGALNALEEGATVSPELLMEKGMIKKVRDGLRVLGQGDLQKKFVVRAHHFSESAKRKIEEAGGSVEVLS